LLPNAVEFRPLVEEQHAMMGFRQAAETHLHSGRPDYGQLVHDYIADLGTTDPQRILNATPNPSPTAPKPSAADAGANAAVGSFGPEFNI
jgi:hypothetical protein